MKILVTSAATQLSQALAASLAPSHEVVTTDRASMAGPDGFVQSGLGDDPSTNDLVRGVDAIVHSGEPDSTGGVSDQLDAAMRCTYNLLWAAVEACVPRFVFLSSLRLMAVYHEELAVTERWRTAPSTDVIDLCYHLGEYTCREFAREGKIDLVCLRLGDVNDLTGSPLDGTSREYAKVDVSNLEQVVSAAEGMDAIVNLSVLRPHRQVAFDVNARGCYNTMTAAVEHGIRRVINTGPHFTIAGPSYEGFDYDLGPDIPPQPGTNLYGLTKSLGQEICRVFTQNHDVYVITLLFYNFRYADDHSADGQDFTPFSVTWSDAGEAFRPALSVDGKSLASRCEIFNIFADIPHSKFSNEKAKRVLGWHPTNRLEQFWRKARE